MAACKTETMFSRTCPHSERLDSKIRSRRNSAEKLCMGGVHRIERAYSTKVDPEAV